MGKKKAKSPSKRAPSGDREQDFETSMARVEQIVPRLESGELGLSESLQQYEAGIKALKRSHQMLQAAEQKVTLLSGYDADGNPLTEPLQAKQNRTGSGRTRPSGPPRSGPSDGDDSQELF